MRLASRYRSASKARPASARRTASLGRGVGARRPAAELLGEGRPERFAGPPVARGGRALGAAGPRARPAWRRCGARPVSTTLDADLEDLVGPCRSASRRRRRRPCRRPRRPRRPTDGPASARRPPAPAPGGRRLPQAPALPGRAWPRPTGRSSRPRTGRDALVRSSRGRRARCARRRSDVRRPLGARRRRDRPGGSLPARALAPARGRGRVAAGARCAAPGRPAPPRGARPLRAGPSGCHRRSTGRPVGRLAGSAPAGRPRTRTAAGGGGIGRDHADAAWRRKAAENDEEPGHDGPGSSSAKFGGDLLSQGESHPSTIGAGGLNFRVRNGNGCDPAAMATETCCQTGARP